MKIRVLLILLLLSGCATPTIKNSVKIEPVNASSISNGRLIGGDGLDWGIAIGRRKDGSYTLFGNTWKSFGESHDIFIASYTADNRFLWAYTYGGTHIEELRHGFITTDGGFLLLGTSQSLFYTAMKAFSPSREARPIIIKLDFLGNIEWAKTIDDSDIVLNDAIQMKDGNYLAVGNYGQSSNLHALAVKIAGTGEVEWAYQYTGNIADVLAAVKEGGDSSAVLIGYTMASKEQSDLLAVKIDKDGAPLWAKFYKADKHQVPWGMEKSSESSYVATGWTGDGEAKNIFAAQISDDGRLEWCQIYKAIHRSEAISIVKGHGGDLVIVGRTGDPKIGKEDGVALLVDENDGDLKKATLIQGSLNDEIMAATADPNENYSLFGDTESFGATYADQLLLQWLTADPGIANAFTQEPLAAAPVDLTIKRDSLIARLSDITDYVKTKKLELRK